MILGLSGSMISRKNEYDADQFASVHHSGEDLISALKKLTEKNFNEKDFINYLYTKPSFYLPKNGLEPMFHPLLIEKIYWWIFENKCGIKCKKFSFKRFLL